MNTDITIPDVMPRAPSSSSDVESWAVYNAMRDLPIGNRTPLSKLRKDQARISRYVPGITSLNFIGGTRAGIKSALMSSLGPLRLHCLAIDASLTSTGVVVLLEGDGGLFVWSSRSGYKLKKTASNSEIEHRKMTIVKSVIKALRAIQKHFDIREVPSYIEDYAFGVAKSGNTSSIIQLAELQGAIKIQTLVLTGVPVNPVPISTARSSILCKGSAKKDEILDAMVDGGFDFVRDESWSDDEIDALIIALTHYTSKREPDYKGLAISEIKQSASAPNKEQS